MYIKKKMLVQEIDVIQSSGEMPVLVTQLIGVGYSIASCVDFERNDKTLH